MTGFEIAIPFAALAVAVIGTLILRRQTQDIDARIAARVEERRPPAK